jgi:TniQ
MRDLEQLPRSLDPLPGESLGGFLLRLSWRLRVSPAELARVTGCAGGRQVYLAPSLLLTFDAQRFARAARLSVEEASSLGIASLADRYPPIAASRTGPEARIVLDGWVISSILRYCPDCLAGDGGSVQREYGGPWQRIWHLPFTFACVQHRRFLRQSCPELHSGDRPRWQLISYPSASGLHPLQCRLPLKPGKTGRYRSSCGIRLDQVGEDDRPHPSPEALDLQERLLAILSPWHPAEEAAYTFADLRLISTFLCMSWPLGENLVDPALVSAVGEHVWRLHHHYYNSIDRQPISIHATAGLLTAAAVIRDSDDLEGTLASLDRRGWSNSRQAMAALLSRHQPACSPRLFKAALPLAKGPVRIYKPLG